MGALIVVKYPNHNTLKEGYIRESLKVVFLSKLIG
jgi:hypothetical protein